MSYMTASERQTTLSAGLVGARSRGMLVQSLDRITEAFGFSYFALFNAPSTGDSMLLPLIVETSIPAQFLRDFDRSQLLSTCRLLSPARESILPSAWQLRDSQPSAEIDCPRELKKFLIDRDLCTGFVFSAFSAEAQRLVFWFSGKRNSFTQNEINELSMLVLQALASYNTIRRNGASTISALSAREVEVIRWTAQGKTSVEIAQILSLSDHTVNAYMTNAIRKFDCVNRTQLVAKAIRLKLIN